MVTKRMAKISDQLLTSQPIETACENLKNLNDIFFTNNFNAFEINNALDGNLLTFTLLYCYQKFDWKNLIPQLDE